MLLPIVELPILSVPHCIQTVRHVTCDSACHVHCRTPRSQPPALFISLLRSVSEKHISPFLPHSPPLFAEPSCSCLSTFIAITSLMSLVNHPNPRSEPYDPYLPRNGSSSNPSGSQGNPKTAAIQQQIDDTVGIMRENITKVAERGERLDSLQDKTG